MKQLALYCVTLLVTAGSSHISSATNTNLPAITTPANRTSTELNQAEAIDHFKAFAVRKRDYLKQLSKENDLLLVTKIDRCSKKTHEN